MQARNRKLAHLLGPHAAPTQQKQSIVHIITNSCTLDHPESNHEERLQDRYVLAQIWGFSYIQIWAEKRVGGIYQYISRHYESPAESAWLLSSAASLATNTNEKLNLSLDKHLLEWKLQGVESLKEKCPPSGEGRVWIFFGTTQNEHP